MKNIYELARLIGRTSETFTTMIPKSNSSPLKKLSVIAFSKLELTDEQCMKEIYGKRNVNAFSSLKARLFDKLSLLILLNEGGIISNEEVYFHRVNNLKRIVVCKILLGTGSMDVGLQMLEKATDVAIKNEFTENVIIASRRLIIYFGSERYNKFKHRKYSEIQKKYINIYLWEVKALNYYFELQKTSINSLTIPTKELIKKSVDYIKDLEGANDINSTLFLYNLYRIKAIYYEYIKDYNGLLSISQQTIKNLTLLKYKFISEISNTYIRIIFAYIQTEKFSEAIVFGRNVIRNITPETNSWIRLNYYLSKAFIYSEDYLSAIELIIAVNEKKYLKKFPNYLEIINTVLGYLNLLIDFKFIKISNKLKGKVPEFRLGKYLNSVPIFSKDKRGINISILLLHIAFLLQRKDYNTIIDRTDSLNQYAYRYLRRDDSFRSNCMIKMVIQMTKADFHPARTERYTADLLIQLKSVKLAGSGENIEIEMIPFEVLWEIMLKSLKD